MLQSFSKLWYSKLGQTSVAGHSIDLIPESSPVRSAPYQAGPEVREIQRSEIARTLEREAIKPTTTGWVSVIVIAP